MSDDNKKLTWADVINQIDLTGPSCRGCGREIPLGTANVFGFCAACAEKRFTEYAALQSQLQQTEKALNLACGLIAVYGLPSGTDDMQCKLAQKKRDYFLQQAKEAANKGTEGEGECGRLNFRVSA